MQIRTTHLDHLQLMHYYLGTFEPHCLSVMRRHVKPGDTILDVGANIGLFTIEGAQAVGRAGRVISIEAAPTHAESVRQTCLLNRLSNVDIFPVAVGNEDGQATLTLPRDTNFGMFTLGAVSGDQSFSVPVRRIDDIVGEAGVQRIDFIKMDIEGSETAALRGAEQTISTYRPTIMIELNEAALNACGSSAQEVKDCLFDWGYQGWLIRHGSLEPISRDQSHSCDECLFIHGNQ